MLTVLDSHLSLYGLISSCQLKMDTSFTAGWSTATGAALESYDKPNDTNASRHNCPAIKVGERLIVNNPPTA